MKKGMVINMGSYENIIKIEELRKKMEEGDVFSAQRILDTIDVKKVKNISDLGVMAEVYMANEYYDEAAQLYVKIHNKTRSRKSLSNLVEVSIKRNNVEDAEDYLKEYKKAAPQSFYLYVFRYRIDKMKGEAYEVLINTLEALKELEYTEQWAYELAKTYYKAGMEEECIRECSDIVLWFGEGPYVEKAKILRSYYSGEADKDTILEEIKRRAEKESQRAEQQPGAYEDEAENYNNYMAEEREYNSDFSGDSFDETTGLTKPEEVIYSETAFIPEEEAASFENELKRDIQSILFSETSQEDMVTDSVDMKEALEDTESFYGERSLADIDDGIEAYADVVAEEASYIEQEKNEESVLAEQEVEDTIYRLLQEEDIDEEDRKLKQLAQELKLSLEEIFGNFLHVKAVKKQLVKSLLILVEDNRRPIQLIITGTKGAGKTTLAKDMALFLNQLGLLKSSRIAKIKAEKLNSIDILSKKETLKDCCMVVENASELNRKTIEGILELSVRLNGELAVIYEEDKKNINKMFREYPKLMDLCKNRIHLPQYTQEDLLGFAMAYLRQKDYKITPKAEIKLRNRMSQMAKEVETSRQLEQMNELMQRATNATDIRMGKELSSLAAQGRLKDVELMLILPEDIK